MNKFIKIKGKNEGLSLVFSVIALSIFGVVMIYSASNYFAESVYGNKFFFVTKQIVGVLLGVAGMIFTYNFNYQKLKKYGLVFVIVGIVLLALVFVPFLSVEIYGAKRWIKIAFFTIQPSEIAKFCYIIFVASYFSKNSSKITSFLCVLPPVAVGGIICLLIIIEPNMSITMCVAILMISLLFICGVKLKHILVFVLPVVALVPILIAIEPYRLARFSAFLNPWASPKGEGYQLLQSLYALGLGGLFGVGLFNSRQKYKFLPFAESDFILSVIGEEFGFFGVLLLFVVFGFIIYKGFKTAIRSKDFFSYILAMGITLIFAIQVLINALVVTGSIPPTGLPLPLISAGNTSLIVYLSAFGLLGNVANHGDNLTKFN